MTREFWRTVPDFPDYEVSTGGRIRRRVTAANGLPAGRELKPWLGLGGALYVSLRRDGRTHSLTVNAVHASAFNPPMADRRRAS